MRITICFIAMLAGCVASADDLRPIKYECATNYLRYDRWLPTTNLSPFTSMVCQTTNVPAAVVHSVTWGRGTNAVFILHTQEKLKVPIESNGWYNAEMKWYDPAVWVEGVKK